MSTHDLPSKKQANDAKSNTSSGNWLFDVATPLTDVKLVHQTTANPGKKLMPVTVLQLQRTVGNRATVSLLNRAGSTIQRCNCGRALQDDEECPSCRVQRTTTPGFIQRFCTANTECAPRPGDTGSGTPDIPGSAGSYARRLRTPEERADARRERMTPERQTERGHRGPARQLEIFLRAENPSLMNEIHGIFISMDLQAGAEARLCTDVIPPVTEAAPGASCVIVHGPLNQEALQYNRTEAATIGGVARDIWRVRTLQLLTHEIQHVIDRRTGFAIPAGASPTCASAETDSELSELRSIISEFPVVYRAIPDAAPDNHPMQAELEGWFNDAILNEDESIRGTLRAMGCRCECSEVDAFVIEMFEELTANQSWSDEEKAFFHGVMNMPAWDIRWPFAAPSR